MLKAGVEAKMEITKILQDQLLATIDNAVQACLAIYAGDDFGTQTKADNSPVTRADLEVYQILTEALTKYTPDIPVVSEEANIPYEQRKEFEKFWIIDPIDGTKEFVKQTNEFTINLGLIENQELIISLSEIGVAFLIFTAGLEINFKKLRQVGKAATFGGVLQITILFGLAFFISMLIRMNYLFGL